MPPEIAAARPGASTRGGRAAADSGSGSGNSKLPSFRTAGSGARPRGGPAAFKPPRPQAGRRVAQEADEVEMDDAREKEAEEEEEREEAEQVPAPRRRRRVEDDEGDDDNNSSDDDDSEPAAPSLAPELLTRLLHHAFHKPNTRITQDANAAVGKYIETFVREAVARAVAERRDGGFLDVDVLQKVAPQLIMDM